MNSPPITKVLRATLPWRKSLAKLVTTILMYTGLLTVFVIVYDLGFPKNLFSHEHFEQYYLVYITIGLICYGVKNLINFFNRDKQLKLKVIDFAVFIGFLFFYSWLVQGVNFKLLEGLTAYYKYIIAPFFMLSILMEMSRNLENYYLRNLNPALIFVLIFFVMIMLGTGMLLLPNATYDRISLVDAFFTASSAVCITGLIVVDTATVFTQFGHFILMILMQLGGLGIMTFAGFVGHMFSSGITFQQQMMLKEYVSGQQLSNVIRSIYKIVLITLLVEFIGAIFIFFSTMEIAFPSLFDRIFFAAFHAISAFCNAGFMTVTDGLNHIDYRFNYPLQWSISFLFLFGGIGFPIVFNFYSNIKLFLTNSFRWLFMRKRFHHIPNAITFNSKIMLWTTAILTLFSFIIVFWQDSSLAMREHGFWGKITASFFLATSTRSAGFHNVDMSLLSFPTAMFFLLMMWIGASPGGTGGGIRTTTFAISTLNFWNTARGRERIILFGREIPQTSLRRAFAIISLSIIMMGVSSFLIYSFDGHLSTMSIIFDVFSAFNNCGMSLGVTPELSEKSKFVLAITMFIGRVSALTLLSAFIFKRQFQNVRYPTEDIIY